MFRGNTGFCPFAADIYFNKHGHDLVDTLSTLAHGLGFFQGINGLDHIKDR